MFSVWIETAENSFPMFAFEKKHFRIVEDLAPERKRICVLQHFLEIGDAVRQDLGVLRRSGMDIRGQIYGRILRAFINAQQIVDGLLIGKVDVVPVFIRPNLSVRYVVNKTDILSVRTSLDLYAVRCINSDDPLSLRVFSPSADLMR